MIESRCGLRCSDCNFRESMGCKGCVNMDKPFWADSCPVKSCCEKKGLQHCGECDDFVCPLLHTFAYDMEQSDNGAESSNAKNGVTIMASSKEYLHFILEQLSDLDDMPRPGGIRVGSSSSSSSGSSPPTNFGAMSFPQVQYPPAQCPVCQGDHIRSVCRRPAAVVVLLSESVQQLVHHLFAERFCLPRCVVLRELHNL